MFEVGSLLWGEIPLVVSTLDKALAKVSDCPKKSSHKALSQIHDVPMSKDDIFGDGVKVQADLASGDDGANLPEAQVPSAEVAASDVQPIRRLHVKRGLSDFLRYEAVGDGLVRVGKADVMPDIAVITGQHGQPRLPDQKDSSRIFLPPHRGEMGPNQYRQVVVDRPCFTYQFRQIITRIRWMCLLVCVLIGFTINPRMMWRHLTALPA